jgi:hypothetical protein
MSHQSPQKFIMGGIHFMDDQVSTFHSPWSITLTITSLGAAGFYVVNDPTLNIWAGWVWGDPTPVPVEFESTTLLHTYTITITGNDSDFHPSAIYDWRVERFIVFLPEQTDAATQSYQLDWVEHNDYADSHIGSKLNAFYQYPEFPDPLKPYDYWYDGSAYLEVWWQSGVWFGDNHVTDFSYSGNTHTDLVADSPSVNLLEMIIEQN